MHESEVFPRLTGEQAEKAVRSFDPKANLHAHDNGTFCVRVGDPKDVPGGVEIKKGKKWEAETRATPDAAWYEAARYLNIASNNLVLCESCFTFLRERRDDVRHPNCPAWA